MSDKKNDATRVITPTFRACFVNVFAPTSMPGSDKEKYGITMLFENKKQNLRALEKAVDAAIEKKWGKKPPKGLQLPFRDGGEKEGEYDSFEEGMVWCTARSDVKPGLVDENVEPIIERSDFYSGCYARASIAAFAYDKAGNKGVSFLLNNVQKVKDGEPLGNQRRAEDDFESVDTDDDDDRPSRRGRSSRRSRDDDDDDLI